MSWCKLYFYKKLRLTYRGSFGLAENISRFAMISVFQIRALLSQVHRGSFFDTVYFERPWVVRRVRAARPITLKYRVFRKIDAENKVTGDRSYAESGTLS